VACLTIASSGRRCAPQLILLVSLTKAMTVTEAIRQAESVLPGRAAPDGRLDPRWQAIIAVGRFVKREPKAVWRFARRWGSHGDADLRAAIGTCLLEHLLEHHFDSLYPYVQRRARTSKRFADTLQYCWKFGQAKRRDRAAKLDRLLKQSKLTGRFSRRRSRLQPTRRRRRRRLSA
jgi:hypothetical protein